MAPRTTEHPKRRKSGSGTIRYKPGRESPWEAAFPLGHGQHRYDYFSTRPEAEAHLDRLTEERDDKDQPRNITGGSQRVDLFLPAWLETKRGLKPKTFRGYTYYCELASGQLGTYRVDQISRERADGMIAYFERRGFQNTAQMRACLLQAFEYALDEDYIKKNPFKKVKVTTVERREGVALTLDQRDQLLLLAEVEDRLRLDDATIPLYPLWHIYSRLGLRRGEGIALLWGKSGVNLEVGALTISRQITTAGKGQIEGTPPNVVQAIAGHGSQAMTRHYVDHADMESMRKAFGV
jgi:integrase